MGNYAQSSLTGAERVIGASLSLSEEGFAVPTSCEAGISNTALVIGPSNRAGTSGDASIDVLLVHIDPKSGALTRKAMSLHTKTGLGWSIEPDPFGGFSRVSETYFGDLSYGGGGRWWLPYLHRNVEVDDELGILSIDVAGSTVTIGEPVVLPLEPATVAYGAVNHFNVPVLAVLDDLTVIALAQAPQISDGGIPNHEDIYIWAYRRSSVIRSTGVDRFGNRRTGYRTLPTEANRFPYGTWRGVSLGRRAIFAGPEYTMVADSGAVVSVEHHSTRVNFSSFALYRVGATDAVIWGTDQTTNAPGSLRLDARGIPATMSSYARGPLAATHRKLGKAGVFLTYDGSPDLPAIDGIPPSQTRMWQVDGNGIPLGDVPINVRNDPAIVNSGSSFIPVAAMTLVDNYVLVAPGGGTIDTCYVVRINSASINNLKTHRGKPRGVDYW